MREPKIRFKGFEGEWGNCNLEQFAPKIPSGRSKSSEGLYNLYGSTGIIGTTAKCDYSGEMLLIARVGANAGRLQLVNENCGITDNTLIIKLSHDSTDYIYFFLQYYNLNRLVFGSGQPLITGSMLKKVKIQLGNPLEQQQIASYFKSLDTLIQLTTKKIATLKQLKSASLVSMFPQIGERKPRARFKGFKEDWKTVPFDIVFRYLKNNTLSRADLNETLGNARNIHYGDILIKFGTLIDIRKDDLPYITNHFLANQLTNNCNLQKGDIVFADAAEDSTVGKCAEIAFIGEEKVVAGLHTIPCRTLFEFSEGYLGFYLNSPSYHNQLLPLMQGTKISSISKSALLNTSISFPSSIAEQRQIASFFRSLDTQISLETQRLDKLKQIKSACLDKMFV